MSLLFNWRTWAAAVLLAGLGLSHWQAYVLGGDTVRSAWLTERADIAAQSQKLATATADKSALLVTQHTKILESKNAQITDLDKRIADTLISLRDRPKRPIAGIMPDDTSVEPATSCTGAGLYFPDAEFLVRESHRANALIAELGECQGKYETVRLAQP